MNLDGLLCAAERATRRTEESEREDALLALAGKHNAAQIHYARLSTVDVHTYLKSGETIELHLSLLPPDEKDYGGLSPARKFRWPMWTAVKVEHIGDCVRVIVPGYGSMPIPVGDFVRAVLTGRARAPVPAQAENTG